MHLRILGTHNFESRDTRMAGYVIDDVLALDAGSLTRSLTFDQQRQLRAIILSHSHLDHTRDLWPLGLYAWGQGITIDVYGIQDTIDYVVTHLLHTHNNPDFREVPSPENPVYRFHVVEYHEEFEVLDYTAVAVPVPHLVPAAGYQIASDSVKLFYTGDTGKDIGETWDHVSPDVLLTEVTYGNENESLAIEVGHLTPAHVGEILSGFRSKLGYLPIVIASHINPPWEEAVRRELKDVSRELGIEIIVSEPDQTMNL